MQCLLCDAKSKQQGGGDGYALQVPQTQHHREAEPGGMTHLWHDGQCLLVHVDEEPDVACKLAQQRGEEVHAEYVGVGPFWGQLPQGLGVADAEEQAGSQEALQRGLLGVAGGGSS